MLQQEACVAAHTSHPFAGGPGADRFPAAARTQHTGKGFGEIHPPSILEKQQNICFTWLELCRRKVKELRYREIKVRTVKSTRKVLNSITSKWLRFSFQWERNYSLGSLNLIPYFQPQNIYIKKVVLAFWDL